MYWKTHVARNVELRQRFRLTHVLCQVSQIKVDPHLHEMECAKMVRVRAHVFDQFFHDRRT